LKEKIDLLSFNIMVKRKNTSDISSNNKTLKLDPYRSPYNFKGFATGNTLQDWLERFYKEKRTPIEPPRTLGLQFEDYVCKYLQDSGLEITTIDSIDTNAESLTLLAMREGKPFIRHGVIKIDDEKIMGIPDLLVRSDHVVKLFPSFVDNKKYADKSPCAFSNGEKWHYVVVDIKFKSILLCVDGFKIRNDESTKFYKTQVYIYNRILGKCQNYRPHIALILGRSYTCASSAKEPAVKRSDFMQGPAVVELDDWDVDTEKTYIDGRSWLDRLDAEGSTWSTDPIPSVPELYANAKASSVLWGDVIKHIAYEQNELSLLWYCGAKQKQKAHSQGLTRLSQITSSDQVGFKSDTKTGATIEKFLSVNKAGVADPNSMLLLRQFLLNNPNKVFLDFESLPVANVNYQGRCVTTSEKVYLCCLKHEDGSYEQWGLDKDNDSEEYIAKSLFESLTALTRKNKKVKVCHWGLAEIEYIKRLEDRHKDYPLMTRFGSYFVDLCDFVTKNCIILPGMYDFSLKSIGYALAHTSTSGIQDGFASISKAEIIFFSSDPDDVKQGHIDDLKLYNRTDCDIMANFCSIYS